MTIYCIDDGGDGSQTNTTQSASTLDWSKADTSVDNLIAYDAAAFTTSGNIIYFGDDHNDPNKAAHWTLTGPTSGLPVILISADRTQSTPTYKKGTGNQLSSLGGAYNLTVDGSFACYGIRMVSGNFLIPPTSDVNESAYCSGCTLVLPANGQCYIAGNLANMVYKNLTVDLTADGTTARSNQVFINDSPHAAVIQGLTFVNAGYRTGTVFGTGMWRFYVSGADFSGFTNGTACEIANAATSNRNEYTNCLTAATWTPTTGTPTSPGQIIFTNCGPADAPTYLYVIEYGGTVISTTSIYRTGGATVEGDACSWLITTTANCAEGAPFYTPYIYGTVSSTGSKTFDLYITNDTADLTDAEAWLEVEYLSTSDEAIWALATDQRTTTTTTAAAQTDDTTSTWNGTGPSFTYKQKLSVTATVNETGQFRARVAVGKASIASSVYFYVDPKIGIS